MGLEEEFDIFGVGISFNYKSEETYKSLLGGIFSIVFIIVCIIFLIPSFIEFIRNRPVSVIYYTKELNNTDTKDSFNRPKKSSNQYQLRDDNYDGYDVLRDLNLNI